MFVGVVSILLLPLFSSFINRQSSRIYSGRLLLFQGLVFKKLGWPFDAEKPPYHPPESKFILFWFLETKSTEAKSYILIL